MDNLTLNYFMDEVSAVQALKDNFDTVFRKHLQDVQRLIRKYCRNEEDVLDLTQEVFLRAYCAWPAFRGECSISTWLYRIATNVCVNAKRFGHRARELPSESAMLERLLGWYNDEFYCNTNASDIHFVRRALHSITAEQLVVLTLRFSDQLSIPEIADIVGVPVDTAKSRLRSALSKIRASLIYQNVKSDSSIVANDLVNEALDEIILDGPFQANIYHSLGSKYLEKGMIEAALREWQKAQKLKPDKLDAYLDSAREHIRASQPERAVEVLENAVEWINDDMLHITLAQAHCDLGAVDRGLVHSLNAIKLKPNNALAHYVAGRLCSKRAEQQYQWTCDASSGDFSPDYSVSSLYEESISYYKHALVLDPTLAKAKSSLAVAIFMSDSKQEALRLAEEAVNVAPQDDLVLSHAGWIAQHAGRFESAAKYLRKCIEIKPTVRTFGILAEMQAAQGNIEEARELYLQARELSEKCHTEKNDKIRLYGNLSYVSLLLGNYDEAVIAAKSALKLDPNEMHAQAHLAKAYLRRGEPAHIVAKLCRDGLKIDNSVTWFHHILAEALLRLGDYDEALREADCGVTLTPQEPEAWLVRARVLLKHERKADAINDLHTAAEMAPSNQTVLDLLARVKSNTQNTLISA